MTDVLSAVAGSYDVLFYDGFKKTVQAVNIKTMPSDVRKQYADAGVFSDTPTSSRKGRSARKGRRDSTEIRVESL